MLAIAVKHYGPFKSKLEGMRQSRLERRSFAAVVLMSNHDRSGIFGLQRRVIRRTVIHDDHEGKNLPQRRHQTCDGLFFIETGNDGGRSHYADLFCG